MSQVPVPEYPGVMLDVVHELRMRNGEAAAKLVAGLDPDLAVVTLASMYAELLRRHEVARGLEPGRLAEQIRQEYAAVAKLCEGATIDAPALFGGAKRQRRIER